MATIKDVAERAGISTTLVSRYLNGQKGVSESSKKKIMEAIRELNYRPNGIARSLVLQKTHSIGIVLDNLCAPFAARLIRGLEQGAGAFDKDNNYNVLYCSSNGDMQKKKEQVQFLTQGRVDGIIIYGSLLSDDAIISQLASSAFPFLLIENDLNGFDVNKVVIDNMEGAYQATEYLIRQGHKRIAHIAGNMNLKITLERLNGYIRALQDNQIAVDQELIRYPDLSSAGHSIVPVSNCRGDITYYEAGYEEMKRMLNKEILPDALFFATDISAFGAIKALEEAGIKVPEDVSVIGFDDEAPGDYGSTCRPITTMRQPLQEAGYIGIKTLIHSIQYPEFPKERVVLKTELIVRDSCNPQFDTLDNTAGKKQNLK
ncbi:MAG: LacI family DNA-binding transcriptional regulator [Anaerocolumna sp.]